MRRFASTLIAAVTIAAAAAPLGHAAELAPANAQQMSEIAGDYQLSDGRRLQIDFDGTDVYVQVDKRPRQHLRGTSDGQFSTFDGAITIRHRSSTDAPILEIMMRGQSVSVLR